MSELKKKGSFWIPREAVSALINNKASALQICTYLVIAKQTGKEGYFSICGLNAIMNRIGVDRNQALFAINALLNMNSDIGRLIISAYDWDEIAERLNDEQEGSQWLRLPPRKRFTPINWVVNIINSHRSDGAWFDNDIVEDNADGKGGPLSYLKNDDFAAQIFILMHSAYDLGYEGIVCSELCKKSNLISSKEIAGYKVCQFQTPHEGIYSSPGVAQTVCYLAGLEINEENFPPAIKKLNTALSMLDRRGFLLKVILVMNKSPMNKEASVLYELDIKSEHGYVPRDRFMLADRIEKVASRLGLGTSSGNGGFYDKYPVIVPSDIDPHVVTAFRLIYGVSGDTNPHVRQTADRKNRRLDEAISWISELDAYLSAQASDTYSES